MLRSAAVALLLWQITSLSASGPAPEPRYFQYERPLVLVSNRSGQTCATLDATVYAHAATESLNDIRLYASGSTETPFTVTESGTAHVDEETAAVRNAGLRGGDIVFDLQMPRRPYTAVNLDLNAKDFLATAKVSGSDSAGGAPVQLGNFALFDLGSQHLSRSTTLPLQESTFAQLHIELHVTPSPGHQGQHFGPEIVHGASVPPSREAQTLFVPVAEVTEITQQGRESVAAFHVPAHVPVERVSFVLDPGFHKNFLRTANITARPDGMHDNAAENMGGEISHTQLPAFNTGWAMDEDMDKLSIQAVLGADLQQGATVEVAIENGDGPALPVRAVRLEMRERRLCFDAANNTSYRLRYGDAALSAPHYEYATLFTAEPNPASASLGLETKNPSFVARVDTRPYTERHPELLWVALIAAVAALGSVALRSTRKHQ